jgi:L-aminopeptidase/D-esterase-like protein
MPGPLNAITDVRDVQVGHTTLTSGEGKLQVGRGPVRTGVTAILPRGRTSDPVFAGWYSLNGNGEMTGTTWVEESGFLEGPVMLTNTHSVGLVRDAVVAWTVDKCRADPALSGAFWSLPVVAETYDGGLNDINGFHVKQEHVFAALERASSGPVSEGNVGGGTGMVCHSFKGGIGTASRQAGTDCGRYTVGVLVQANYGDRRNLTVAGAPVGREIPDLMPVSGTQVSGSEPAHPVEAGGSSIIVVVATDAPLLPHQLKRLARRVPLGIARVGGMGANSSGDIFIAFSTANPGAAQREKVSELAMMPNSQMTSLFEATVFATEEAIINTLVAAETMVGINGTTVYALPHDRLQQVLAAYNRVAEEG